MNAKKFSEYITDHQTLGKTLWTVWPFKCSWAYFTRAKIDWLETGRQSNLEENNKLHTKNISCPAECSSTYSDNMQVKIA